MATTTRDSEPKVVKAVRRKRTAPERTAPERNMTAMLRGKSPPGQTGSRRGGAPSMPVPPGAPAQPRPGAANAANAANVAPPSPAAAETAEHRAVRSGYELCEAAIRRGQEAAKRFAPNLADVTSTLKEAPGAKEALGMAEGALRVWADLATAWMRAVMPLAPAGFPDPLKAMEALREALSGEASGHATGQATGHATAARGQAISFAVEVLSARPARVAFELSREVDVAALAVQPLQSLDRDPAKPALLGVELHPSKDGRSVEIVVAIAGAQPPGRYLGAVYDKVSGTLVGGLTIDLKA